MFAVSLEKKLRGIVYVFLFFFKKKNYGMEYKNFECYKFSKLRETGGGENVGIKEKNFTGVKYDTIILWCQYINMLFLTGLYRKGSFGPEQLGKQLLFGLEDQCFHQGG